MGPHDTSRGSWSWPPNSLLGDMDPVSRDKLLGLGKMIQYPTDRSVIREGEASTFVLVLLDGVVKATARSQDSRDALLAVRVGGDLVGELGVLDGRSRSATITTCGVVVARLVPRDGFLAFLRAEPRVSEAVHRSIIGKLRTANARRIDFAGCDVLRRVARVLYELANSYGVRDGRGVIFGWPLTHSELATLVGAAEPTVQKALRELRVAGAVSTGYRRFCVTDLEKLKAAAFGFV